MRSTVLIFDGDGVFLEFSSYMLGLIGSTRTAADVTQWDLFGLIETWHGLAKRKEALALCDTPDYWRNQPAMPGAAEALAIIRSEEYNRYNLRVKFVTSPWDGCSEWGHVRRKRLKELFDVSSKDVVEAHDKSGECARLFVDDKPSHIVEWDELRGHEGRAVLFDQPYNRPSSTPAFEWHRRLSWGPDDTRLRALIEEAAHSTRAR